MKPTKIVLFICSCLIILQGCANQQAPSGGDVDRIPPRIVRCFPDSNSIDFKKDYVEFRFSKYVDKRSFRDALFISPTIDGEMDFSWSGKSVEITFEKGFKPNRTYNLTVGTDVVDYFAKNRMAKSYTLTFSTGPTIDKGVIEGMVYEDKPSGVMAYAYIASDTLDITKHKPEYVSQVGEKGDFRFNGLAPATYRVFVVKDDFKDFLFHPEKNLIGVPSRDVTISATDTLYTGLHYFLTQIDTVKPRLVSANMTDRFHVLAGFSEEPDVTRLGLDNFSIIDSTRGKTFKPVYAFKGKAKPTEYVLTVSEPFSDSNKVYLKAEHVFDKAGNGTAVDFASVLTNQKGDTSAPQLIRLDPPNRAIDQPLDTAHMVFGFDDGFAVDSLKSSIAMTDTTKNTVPIKIVKIDDAAFSVTPAQKLKSNTIYKITFPFNKVRDKAGNSIDSLYEYRFTTANDLDNTGVHGKLTGFDETKNPTLVLSSLENAHFVYITLPGREGVFNFDKIKPGKYKLYCFYDINKNGVCDVGFPAPFKPAEQFTFMADTISAPARWAVTDVAFDVSGMK